MMSGQLSAHWGDVALMQTQALSSLVTDYKKSDGGKLEYSSM